MRYAYGVAMALLLGGTAFSVATGQAGAQVAQNAPSAIVPRAGAPTSFADLAAKLAPAVVNISTKQRVPVRHRHRILTDRERTACRVIGGDDEQPAISAQDGSADALSEDGGDPLRTLHRETLEELGLTLDPGLVVALWDYPTSRGSHRYVYLYPWDDPEFPFEQNEGKGRGWFTPDEALRTLLLADNARRDLTLLVERRTATLPEALFSAESDGTGVKETQAG